MTMDWDLIRCQFEFLEKEYEGTVTGETDYGLEYRVKNCRIRLTADRDQLMIDFCQLNNNDWLGLSEIINTKDPETHYKYVSLTAESAESEIKKLVQMLKQYGQPFIDGDFSIAQRVSIYRKTRLKELGI